jgi:hypothetical protein
MMGRRFSGSEVEVPDPRFTNALLWGGGKPEIRKARVRRFDADPNLQIAPGI